MSFFRSRIFVACVASTVTALVVGGVGWAAIPDTTTGTITACYPTSGAKSGALRVIDHQAGTRCATGEAMLQWQRNQLRWRGNWKVSASYAANDGVYYHGSAYLATLTSVGIVPTNTTAWSLMASKGATGRTGMQGVQGVPGVQGPKGDPGAQGIQGVPGPSNVSILTLSASAINGADGFISDYVGYGESCASTSTTQQSDYGCHQLFAVGVKVRLTAVFGSGDGSAFDHWTGDCASVATNVCDITMDGDHTVGVVFSR